MNLPDIKQIENKLKKRKLRYQSNLKRTSHYAKKLLDNKALDTDHLRDRSAQILAGAGLTGALLLSPITAAAIPDSQQVQQKLPDMNQELKQSLSEIVPHYPTKLSEDDAQKVTNAIKDSTGIESTPYLEGQSLNHNVGYVGYEQHLLRYPGDTIDQHDEELVAGIAPGKGAWGYFAKSKQEFTTQDYMREKYYSVAQTLYLPNWNQDFRHLRDWYKYRKIIIVNPENGQAVVTALADAGPAEWTGKQFGASPEAMMELDLHKGPRKGLVVFFFVDDPDDKIPLGPVDKKINVNNFNLL